MIAGNFGDTNKVVVIYIKEKKHKTNSIIAGDVVVIFQKKIKPIFFHEKNLTLRNLHFIFSKKHV